MTLAAPSTYRARKSRPRKPRPRRARGFLKIFGGGLALVAVAIVVVVTAMTGVGWLFAVSPEARTGFQPVARATPLDREFHMRIARGEAASRSVIAADMAVRLAAPALPMRVFEPLGALAGMTAESLESPDDRIITALLAPYVPRRVAVEVISRRPELALQRPDAVAAGPAAPQALPRPRPRLASLTPLDGVPMKPDEDRKTAIYDISASTVYLPNGTRLEAHSGLGEHMDDPNSMRLKNRGVTPPNVYNLRLREALFHGVQAIRMTPVNEKDMFGRDGILAHSYMLGPSGQSNGCISFRDYPKFLSAFMRGEVDRIVVVTRTDRPPAVADRSKVRSASAVF